jgi:hypothetical protein
MIRNQHRQETRGDFGSGGFSCFRGCHAPSLPTNASHRPMQPHTKSVLVRPERPGRTNLRTDSRQSDAGRRPQSGAEAKRYQLLLNLTQENPRRLLHVGDIRLLFQIPVHTMVRLRKLAAKDPETDPWLADSTTVPQFDNWLWKIRRSLEKKYPEI